MNTVLEHYFWVVQNGNTMAKLGATFLSLAQAAGVNFEQEVIDKINALATEIDDDSATKLKNDLMTFESAKHNSQLSKHHKAQALNAIDREITEIIDSYGFEQADLDKFSSETSTFKRVRMLHERVKEIEGSKAGGGDDASKKTITDLKRKVDELNTQVLSAKEDTKTAVQAAQSEASQKILSYAMKSHLNGYTYANDQLDKAVNVTVAETLLGAELAAANVKVVHAPDGSLKLVQADNPELDYVVENKMLKVNGSVSTGTTTVKPASTKTVTDDNKADFMTPDIADHYAKQMAGFAEG
jgi:hypothetical protein